MALQVTARVCFVLKGCCKIENYSPGDLLAQAFPDRIAKKRASGQNTFLMASGKGAFFTRPAGRPVQITNDLESFWTNTYKQVKKDLMGRYPKHYWPDDPLAAIPTKRVKPK